MKCPSCGKDLQEGTTFCPYCFRRFGTPPGNEGFAPGDELGVMFNNALTLWKDNLAGLVLFSLAFVLVGWIPILNAAFFAGYTRGLLSLSRGGKAEFEEIFGAWDCFVNTLVYLIIFLLVSIAVGFLPYIAPLAHFALALFATPGLYLVIDRNVNAIDAMKWGIESVRKHFVPWLLVVAVGGLIASIGVVALFIGIIITLPLGMLLVIQQYERVKGDELPARI
jgi:hypothetical protein